MPFGAVRDRAFAILPREELISTSMRLCKKPTTQMELRWQATDRMTAKFKKNLRPLVIILDFAAAQTANPWIAALRWMQSTFSRQQSLAQRPIAEIPNGTIPKKLWRHLFELNKDGNPPRLHSERYEFWIYHQIGKRLISGELALDDSIRHRRFSDDLVALNQKAKVLETLDIAWLNQPADTALDALCTDLHHRWQTFSKELRLGKFKHLDFDPKQITLKWGRPKVDRKDDALQNSFYDKLPTRGITDDQVTIFAKVFREGKGRCRLHPARQSCAVGNRDDWRERTRKLPCLRYLLS